MKTQITTQILKWKYQTEKRSDSWLNSIEEQRRQIAFLLEDSPSLRPYCLNILDTCYQMARKDASKQTKLPEKSFPEIFCFTIEQLLDFDYLPE